MPEIFELTNQKGLRCEISTLGATLVSFAFTDNQGIEHPLVIQHKDRTNYLDPNLKDSFYVGKTIGRYAGRIFTRVHALFDPVNEKDKILLHSGKNGLSFHTWKCVEYQNTHSNARLILACSLNSGDDGFTGNLEIEAEFVLTSNNALEITYRATTDTASLINLTNHSYFNLGLTHSILDHTLHLNASEKLALTRELLPTGEKKQLNAGPEDFSVARKIGDFFTALDTIYCIPTINQPFARLENPFGNLSLEISSNQPICVVFTPQMMHDINFEFPAICFETQGFPDCINQVNFPSNELKQGEEYVHFTRYEVQTKG